MAFGSEKSITRRLFFWLTGGGTLTAVGLIGANEEKQAQAEWEQNRSIREEAWETSKARFIQDLDIKEATIRHKKGPFGVNQTGGMTVLLAEQSGVLSLYHLRAGSGVKADIKDVFVSLSDGRGHRKNLDFRIDQVSFVTLEDPVLHNGNRNASILKKNEELLNQALADRGVQALHRQRYIRAVLEEQRDAEGFPAVYIASNAVQKGTGNPLRDMIAAPFRRQPQTYYNARQDR
jgi:hypothetical protein